jgi:uncharacterized protein (DUF2252 family)
MPKFPPPDGRAAYLNTRRELKMSRSVHAFVRGSTDRFYTWINEQAEARIPAGPAIWICGDCHVGNLGPIGHHGGKTVIELRDLDQTVIGNPAHDLVRLSLSLAMSARSSDLPGVTTARITEDLVAGYERAFEGETVDETIDELPSPIRVVMKRAVKRTWKELFKQRLGDKPREIPLGQRFWPLDARERTALEELIDNQTIADLVTILEGRSDHAEISFADAAFWVKGCSSLGLWRAAVLVKLVEHTKKGSRRTASALLDVKQAVPASAPWAKGEDPGLDPAVRVVSGANRLAPALGARMVPAVVLDRSVYVRELLPQDMKVELDHISPDEGRAVAYYLGNVVGRAHARQLSATDRNAWHTQIASRRSKNIDAPSWLWQALVELVAIHERAYLEHCRRFALPVAHGASTPEVADPELVAADDSPAMRSVPAAADA